VGLQANPDSSVGHGGFIAVNKTTGEQVDYSTTGETNALLYVGGNMFYCSGSNGSTGMAGLFKVPLNGDAETRVVPSGGNLRGYVGLAYDGTHLWAIELVYYSWETDVGQHIVKLDTDLTVLSSQRIDTVANTQNRYPEGKNIYVDNGEVWAVVADASGVYKASLDNTTFTKITCYATHLAFTDTHVFASGGNAVKKINRSTLAIDATYSLTSCRHILWVSALGKLAVSTGNTITYLLPDGTVDSVVSVHTDARQSIWSDGKLLTCSYADNVITNFRSDYVAAIPAPSLTWAVDPYRLERGDINITAGVEVDDCTVSLYCKPANTLDGLTLQASVLNGRFDDARIRIDLAIMPSWNDTSNGLLNLFEGRVTDVKIDHSKIELTVSTDAILLDTQIPTTLYQPSCVHTLYSEKCGAVRSSFTESNTVDTVLDNGVSFVSVNGTGFYLFGSLTFTSGLNTGLSRSLTASTASGGSQFVKFAQPFPYTPSIGDTFTVSAGCDKARSSCKNKFNNEVHFLGWEYMPSPEASV
jgi:uncharacterized phage protein (TIGR02218 family)